MSQTRTDRPRAALALSLLALLLGSCGAPEREEGRASLRTDGGGAAVPEVDHTLTADQTHARFSAAIEPVLRVRSGAVVEAFTEEATDGQLTPGSTAADLANVSFDRIHPLTGPVYVEGADPGDVLVVKLHEVEIGDWGWSAVLPGFGFLTERFDEPFLKTYRFEPGDSVADFGHGFRIPLRPFPGVVGVAPATDSMLSTIPPRVNGGNLDDRDVAAGTTLFFPVLVEGALFSIGDGHAAQGDGEVSGTAIEVPLRVRYQVWVIDAPAHPVPETQYMNDDVYAVTAVGETIDEAARKATGFMVDYLQQVHGVPGTEAYVLASTAANLKIAEVVDVPHMLVTMQLPRRLIPGHPRPDLDPERSAPAGERTDVPADTAD